MQAGAYVSEEAAGFELLLVAESHDFCRDYLESRLERVADPNA